jgi:succinate dehydrogenase/fumarate reductase flavoprotein subunit
MNEQTIILVVGGGVASGTAAGAGRAADIRDTKTELLQKMLQVVSRDKK